MSFVEEHEKAHQINKDRRLKNKDNSVASTNTGNTNSVKNLCLKPNQLKPNRPFSGDLTNQDQKKEKILFKKKIPLARPKTAKPENLGLEEGTNRYTTFNPCSTEEEKALDNRSSHLPEILES